MPPGLADLDLAAVFEVAAVLHTGQCIGQPQQLQAFLREDAFQANGDDFSQPFEEVCPTAGDIAVRIGAAEVQAADQCAMARKRQQRDRGNGALRRVEENMVTRCLEGAQRRAAFLAVQRIECSGRPEQRKAVAGRFLVMPAFQNPADLVFAVNQREGDKLHPERQPVLG